MCFSAPASFAAAAVAGACGLASLARTRTRAELPLAGMPLLFAAQQAVEGALWLALPLSPTGPAAWDLTQIFLVFALVIWPVYAPLSALVIEPDAVRRRWITACLAAGIVVGLYFIWSLHVAPRTAVIAGGHIVYSPTPDLPDTIRVLYPVATCLSLMLSSLPIVRNLGIIVTLGSLVAFFAYWEAFTSVWCFFAAAASGLIVLHFERQRRASLAKSPAA